MENDTEQNKLVYVLLAEYEKKKKEEEKKKIERRLFNIKEAKILVRLSWATFSILGLTLVVAGIIIVKRETFKIDLVWTSIVAGILGSTCSALLSALERKANGWEDKNGNKYPKDEPKDKFSQRMAAFFLFRPLFGILAGLLVFFGMQTNYLADTGIENQPKVVFWSLLAGLFVKTLIEKLKDLFDSLVGKK